MTCKDHIEQFIRKYGPVSFREYMNFCLYNPLYGYYTSSHTAIGANGDFYTMPCVSSLYGELLSRQIIELWKILGSDTISIVEYGGANGKLCNDIMNCVQQTYPDLYPFVHYYIIDVSIKKPILWSHKNVEWLTSGKGLRHLTAIVLSNELIDNFPVHRVFMKNELLEIFVDTRNGNFVEKLQPASALLNQYFRELGIILPNGFKTEINIPAIQWINEVAGFLDRGFVITIDYGFDSGELYQHYRREGTLVCYHRHKINYDPYINPGKQDITTHVNFSSLAHWGEMAGLNFNGYTNQHYFLRSLGLCSSLRPVQKIAAEKITIQENLLLTHFFGDFALKMKVLIQQKAVPVTHLSGMNFQLRHPLIPVNSKNHSRHNNLLHVFKTAAK